MDHQTGRPRNPEPPDEPPYTQAFEVLSRLARHEWLQTNPALATQLDREKFAHHLRKVVERLFVHFPVEWQDALRRHLDELLEQCLQLARIHESGFTNWGRLLRWTSKRFVYLAWTRVSDAPMCLGFQ